MNPYERCPEYETARFHLRQVERRDAEALLACYSDPAAVTNMNADGCVGGFHMVTVEQMRNYIGVWLEEYARGHYVRLAVVDRAEDRAVGTVEIFGGESGVLRIDLPVRWEAREFLEELLALARDRMARDFPMDRLCFKAHTPLRQSAAEAQGFRPSDFRRGGSYWEYRTKGEGR